MSKKRKNDVADDDAADDDAVDDNNKSHKIDDICPICIEPLGEEEIHTTECGHTFHTNCMVEYSRSARGKQLTCPICRANINPLIRDFNDDDFDTNPIVRMMREQYAQKRVRDERAARIAAAVADVIIDSDDDEAFRVHEGGRFCKSRKSKKGRRKSIKRNNSRRKSRRKR